MPGGLGILGCNLRFRVRPSSETGASSPTAQSSLQIPILTVLAPARCGALHAHGQAVEQSTRTRRTSPRRTPHRPYLPAAQSHELAHLREAGRIRADTIRSACLKNHPCHDGVPDARVHGRRLESEHNGAGREGERELESGACNSRSLTPAPSPSPRHVATMFLLCLALHPAAPFTRFTHLRARPPFASQLSVSGADSPQTGTFHDVRPCPQRCDRRNPGFEASATTGLDQEIGADEAGICSPGTPSP
ncbi:hypothetical protein DFH06DRAFT_1247210 [Mycena polygramma]|nr:hypothetical protein DFH06DRAFT_1247210 [Mycena polygramma]